MKSLTVERERKQLADLQGEGYSFDDPATVLAHFNYEWADEVTGVLVKVSDGEYDEVWVTEGRYPDNMFNTYTRIELVSVPDEYHGMTGTNDYVIKCWTWRVPAYSPNRLLKTDGVSLFSYGTKIGRVRLGRQELLNVAGLSKTSRNHVELAREIVTEQHYQYLLNSRLAANAADAAKRRFSVRDAAVVDGKYYFPDEAPYIKPEELKPGDKIIARKTHIVPGTSEIVAEGTTSTIREVREYTDKQFAVKINIDGFWWWVYPENFALVEE